MHCLFLPRLIPFHTAWETVCLYWAQGNFPFHFCYFAVYVVLPRVGCIPLAMSLVGARKDVYKRQSMDTPTARDVRRDNN